MNRRSFMKKTLGVVAISPIAFLMPKKAKEYDLMEDLSEEMNRESAKYPGQDVYFIIHCNYSGLWWLNNTGHLEESIDKKAPEKYVLWFGLIGCPGASSGTRVRVWPQQKTDIFLASRRETRNRHNGRKEHTYTQVTSRCFNIDGTKEGKAIIGLA